jgi:hypothetical protein
MHDQQQKRGSVYNNPQSVYSAKDGAAIPGKNKQNNNLASLMNYREGGMAPDDRVPRSERVEWGEYWDSQDTSAEGNYQPAMSRDRKGARQVKRTINQKIRQGYVDPQGVDYGQFKRVKTRDFMTEANIPAFEDGGNTNLSEKKNIPVTTVSIPMPDGTMYDPSMNAVPNMGEVNMLEMMSGGSTKMSYKNGGPGDPPDSTRVQQLVRKTTHTPPISDKPFQLVRRVTHTPPSKELKVKTTKTSGSSMNEQGYMMGGMLKNILPFQNGGGTGEYDPNKHTWYENLYESTIGQYSDYLQPGYWLGTEKPGATSGGTNKKAIGSGPKIKGEGNVAGSALSITKGLKTKTSSGSMRASEKRAMAKGANRN